MSGDASGPTPVTRATEAAAARGGDFVVVGESFSGPLALLLAARSPPGLRGVVLCATSLTLTASLLNFGLLDGSRALVSAGAVVPAMAGMYVGQRIRRKLSIEQFRLAVFWALLLTGLYTFASRVL